MVKSGRLEEAQAQDQQELAGPLLAARHQRQPGCGAGPAGGAGLIRIVLKKRITTKTGRQEEKLGTPPILLLRGLSVFSVSALPIRKAK